MGIETRFRICYSKDSDDTEYRVVERRIIEVLTTVTMFLKSKNTHLLLLLASSHNLWILFLLLSLRVYSSKTNSKTTCGKTQ